MVKNKTIEVLDNTISISVIDNKEYISLTDMANGKDGDARAADIIKNWIRTRSTLEFLGVWERMNNPNFKVVAFDHFKKEAGLPSFVLGPGAWIKQTDAIGLIVKAGKYGGTYAHKDIAFEFGSAISPVFKLYLIKEYQRLIDIENNNYNIEWNVHRILSKANYMLQTDAVKDYVIPKYNGAKDKEWIAYAQEADLLNVIIFGCSAKEWKEANPKRASNGENLRDIASINELLVLSNLEAKNADMIRKNIPREVRYEELLKTALYQMEVFNKQDVKKTIKKDSDSIYLEELPITSD